jgi:hypothetical protein
MAGTRRLIADDSPAEPAASLVGESVAVVVLRVVADLPGIGAAFAAGVEGELVQKAQTLYAHLTAQAVFVGGT